MKIRFFHFLILIFLFSSCLDSKTTKIKKTANSSTNDNEFTSSSLNTLSGLHVRTLGDKIEVELYAKETPLEFQGIIKTFQDGFSGEIARSAIESSDKVYFSTDRKNLNFFLSVDQGERKVFRFNRPQNSEITLEVLSDENLSKIFVNNQIINRNFTWIQSLPRPIQISIKDNRLNIQLEHLGQAAQLAGNLYLQTEFLDKVDCPEMLSYQSILSGGALSDTEKIFIQGPRNARFNLNVSQEGSKELISIALPTQCGIRFEIDPEVALEHISFQGGPAISRDLIIRDLSLPPLRKPVEISFEEGVLSVDLANESRIGREFKGYLKRQVPVNGRCSDPFLPRQVELFDGNGLDPVETSDALILSDDKIFLDINSDNQTPVDRVDISQLYPPCGLELIVDSALEKINFNGRPVNSSIITLITPYEPPQRKKILIDFSDNELTFDLLGLDEERLRLKGKVVLQGPIAGTDLCRHEIAPNQLENVDNTLETEGIGPDFIRLSATEKNVIEFDLTVWHVGNIDIAKIKGIPGECGIKLLLDDPITFEDIDFGRIVASESPVTIRPDLIYSAKPALHPKEVNYQNNELSLSLVGQEEGTSRLKGKIIFDNAVADQVRLESSDLEIDDFVGPLQASVTNTPAPVQDGDTGVYVIWGKPEHVALPFVKGGQVVFEWGDLDNTAIGNYSYYTTFLNKVKRLLAQNPNAAFTVQINGSRKPNYLFKSVPYFPHVHQAKYGEKIPTVSNTEGALMWWHPTFIKAYKTFLSDLARFMKSDAFSPYKNHVLGIRLNYNRTGTEHNLGHLNQYFWRDKKKKNVGFSESYWVRPNGATFSYNNRNGYEQQITSHYIAEFYPDFRIFNRGNPSSDLIDDYKAGRISAFQTGSEMEPRSVSEIEDRYQVFMDYCRTSLTTCYAEPWAASNGKHGSAVDDRWATYAQWNYWRLLNDLSLGVSYVAVYGDDIDEHTNPEYRRAFDFVNRYAGFLANPSKSPGAWIAFREGNFNVGDYSFLMKKTFSSNFVPLARDKGDVTKLGDQNQRYGAWARKLMLGNKIQLTLDPRFNNSLGNRKRINIVYLDKGNGKLGINLFGIAKTLTIANTNKWQIASFEVDSDSKNGLIEFLAELGDITLHMVEVERLSSGSVGIGSEYGFDLRIWNLGSDHVLLKLPNAQKAKIKFEIPAPSEILFNGSPLTGPEVLIN